METKTKVSIGILIGLLLFGVVLTYSRDNSLPYHLWINDYFTSVYSKGDYVIINYNRSDDFVPYRFLVKRITCVPGDKILRVGDAIFCNGVWMGNALKLARNGKKLPQVYFNEVITNGNYFVSGTNERSYDSRYFGFITGNMIVRRVFPLREFLPWP